MSASGADFWFVALCSGSFRASPGDLWPDEKAFGGDRTGHEKSRPVGRPFPVFSVSRQKRGPFLELAISDWSGFQDAVVAVLGIWLGLGFAIKIQPMGGTDLVFDLPGDVWVFAHEILRILAPLPDPLVTIAEP